MPRPTVFFAILAVPSLCAVTVQDPSDYADLVADAADNAIKANYNIDPVLYQTEDIVSPHYYSGDNDTTLDHLTLSVDANDTSVLVVTEGAQVNLTHVSVLKSGYGSNLFQESFYGLNAAINIANESISHISDSNITVHNGAANIFAFSDNTVVYVTNTDLYSSGPTAHGLYAAGNATIYGSNIRHYSGGNRCSSFAGDNPAGYVHVSDSVAHTAGIGSAIFYALGEVYGTNIVGYAEKAPVLFSDGPQKAFFDNVDLTSDFLAGTVQFSSQTFVSGAYLAFNHSRLRVTGADQPALWFGNIGAEVDIAASEISTASGVLVVANRSQVTQEFSYFAGSEENAAVAAAEVTISVAESALEGDIVAYNGSSISWKLAQHSKWTGVGRIGSGTASLAVSLDATSTWVVTNDTWLAGFTNEDTSLGNVESAGYTVYYEVNGTANAWLNGSTYKLKGGGSLEPWSG